MSEFTPPSSGANSYDVDEAQQFLRSVGQFNQDKLHSDLARNLFNLRLVWRHIDNWIACAPSDGTDASSERVYSGFGETGNFFEVYGFALHFGPKGRERTLYTGNLLFHADLETGNVSTLRPDMSYDEASMQLRFFPGPGAPDATANKFNYEMGRARLTIATIPDQPPEDFNYTYQGERQVLLDTEAFQRHTGLYPDQIRDSIYQPDPSYYNTEPPEDEYFERI